MGKVILISGSNGSGKSRFAEELVGKTTGARYYIATMVSQSEDNERRIEKHKKQREGLDFVTLEIPWQVSKAPVEPDSVVLLEDMTNLLGNTVFAHGGCGEDVYRDICALAEKCGLLIVVTISGMSSAEYTGETAAYIDSINELNNRLSALSDAVAEMVDGIQQWKKGDIHAID